MPSKISQLFPLVGFALLSACSSQAPKPSKPAKPDSEICRRIYLVPCDPFDAHRHSLYSENSND